MNSDELLQSLRTKDAAYWQRLGEERALSLFHEAAERVPAYKDFLKKEKMNAEKIKSIADFQHVPVLDKEAYISEYSLDALSWDGSVSGGSIIAESSGTTGAPFFWPRLKQHETETVALHSAFLRGLFDIDHHKTLYLVCFHLGSHIAGMITAYAMRDIVQQSGQGALMTPGLNKNDIIRCIKDVGQFFDQIVLIGYPPFIKDILVSGSEAGIDWSQKRVRFLFAAESFPETWRSYVYDLAGQSADAFCGINIYGSADTGFMAHETPLTVRMRRSASDDVTETAFGLAPALFQYYPWNKFFEAVQGELICTADSGIPLIRYNLKDKGAVTPFDELSPHVVTNEDWRLPVVSVEGRSNYSVTLYGLNIYPEHIRETLSHPALLPDISGKFFLKTVFDDKQDQYVEVHVELQSDEIQEGILERITDYIVQGLKRVNLEYAKLYQSIGSRATPRVYLYALGTPEFVSKKMKHKYIVKDE